LLIDRSKAPAKVGTFKDISLFGNFKFPTDGQYKSGITAQSLAGLGKTVNKTKSQVQTIALRTVPIAGASGANTREDIFRPSDGRVDGQHEGGDPYSVKFIHLVSDTPCSSLLPWTPTRESMLMTDHQLYFFKKKVAPKKSHSRKSKKTSWLLSMRTRGRPELEQIQLMS